MASDPTNYNCVCDDGYPSATLADMRTYLLIRLGFAAQIAYPPPGIIELLDALIVEAQELLYRRYSVLRLKRWFTWQLVRGVRFYDFAGNSDAQPLPTPVISSVVASTTGGTLAAGTYTYRVTAINSNGQTLPSAEVSVTTTGATSTATVNWPDVVPAAGVNQVVGYAIYGRTAGAELLLATVALTTSWIDTGALTPAGVMPTVDASAACAKQVDFRQIEWAGISQGDNVWRPLHAGIEPTRYSSLALAIPDSYETNQCIEVWPAPSDSTWQLRIKGDFGLQPLVADTDVTTIDPVAIKLLALANGKAHYSQPDAGNYATQLTTYLADLTAGSHQTRRYFPGVIREMNAIPPKMVP